MESGVPGVEEYPKAYSVYVERATDPDIVSTLRGQLADTVDLLRGLTEVKAAIRYAPGKWSVKEVVGHMIDTERIFSTRLLKFARGERVSLPGFDQDEYVAAADFDNRTLRSLVHEYEHVRKSNLALFESLSADAWQLSGTANDASFTVRSIAYIIAGHERHHLMVLRDRYDL